MENVSRKSMVAGLLILLTSSQAAVWDNPQESDSRPNRPARAPAISKLKDAIAEMPSPARRAMSSVVGWSPIYDIEKIPVRTKDIYKIVFDHQGHAAEVLIDEFGTVLNDPPVT
jgi:hypothetical protein